MCACVCGCMWHDVCMRACVCCVLNIADAAAAVFVFGFCTLGIHCVTGSHALQYLMIKEKLLMKADALSWLIYQAILPERTLYDTLLLSRTHATQVCKNISLCRYLPIGCSHNSFSPSPRRTPGFIVFLMIV